MANRTLDDYCFALRTELHLMRDMNTTSTSLSNRTEDFKSFKGTVIRNEVLVVVITIMQLFLVIFGSWRRRSRNFFIQKGVLAAYTLSFSLISYTLGSMQFSHIKSSMYVLWAISVYILFGSAHSITAYSLTDNDQLMRQIFQFVLGFFYVSVLAVLTSAVYYQSEFGMLCALPVCFLASIALVLFTGRLEACQMASASWHLNKMIADYMYQEHTMGEPPYLYDPDSIGGYHYLVDWPIDMSKLGPRTSYVAEVSTGDQQRARHGWNDPLSMRTGQIIDIEKVWQNNGSTDLKDACLSFCLFHLLRRRFFGFECGESSQPKTHDFVFKGLLSSKKQNPDGTSGQIAIVDYDRVYRVIEVELDFMYDFFFTNYAAIYYGSPRFGYVTLSLATLAVVIAFLTAGGITGSSADFRLTYASFVFLHTTASDVVITVAMLVCISVLQVMQVLHYWTTIWARVSFACHCVTGGGCCMGLKERLVHIGVLTSASCRYSNEKIGQYSLLKSVSNISNQSMATKFLAKIENMYLNSFSYTVGGSVRVPMSDDLWCAIRKPGERTELLQAAKKALVQSLERTQGALTNGESSLSSNRADDLLWACKLRLGSTGSLSPQKEENQVCVILTWHIATCYCDKELAGAITEDLNEHHEVATTLSNYTAYLVGFQPKLLPGHHYDTWCVFTVVAMEAIQQSKGIHQDNETIYKKGLRLGEQLKNMEATRCWKVLADFWAEMLLYLAPSDSVKEHVECLAKGGELITHLWALLTHAGILNRGKRNNVTNDTENPADGPSCSYRSTSSTTCAVPSTSETNQLPTTNNPTVQPVEMVVQQPANPVQNGEGARNESNGLSEMEDID